MAGFPAPCVPAVAAVACDPNAPAAILFPRLLAQIHNLLFTLSHSFGRRRLRLPGPCLRAWDPSHATVLRPECPRRPRLLSLPGVHNLRPRAARRVGGS